MKDIKKCKIFVSHRDAEQSPSLAAACGIIKEEIDKINLSGLHKDRIYIDRQDYQFGRNISNPDNGTYQSANSLIKDASKAHAVFILVDGEMGKNIYSWYRPRRVLVSRERYERQVPMPIFWNISDPQSKANCEAFHKRKNCDFIYKYSSNAELHNIVSQQLEAYARRWAASIERKRTIPTLRSICIRLITRVLIFCAIVLSFYFAWPLIDGLISNKPKVTAEQKEQPIPEPYRTDLEKRISNAEVLVAKKKYQQALDSLKAIKAECPSDYIDLVYKIDSLIKIVSTPPTPPAQVVEDNTYIINCGSNALRGYVSNCIRDVLSELSKPKDGNMERWTLNITPDMSILEVPKLIDSDEYMVDIEYGITIKDNLSKKVIHESTISTRGRSPASIDDAKKHSRQLAAQEIAIQLKKSIQ